VSSRHGLLGGREQLAAVGSLGSGAADLTRGMRSGAAALRNGAPHHLAEEMRPIGRGGSEQYDHCCQQELQTKAKPTHPEPDL